MKFKYFWRKNNFNQQPKLYRYNKSQVSQFVSNHWLSSCFEYSDCLKPKYIKLSRDAARKMFPEAFK